MALGQSQRALATAIVRTAQADDTFFNLVGGRIQRAEDPTTKDLELPAVVFTFLPGRVRVYQQKYAIYNLHVLVYSSKSEEECEEVYEAFNTALNTMLLSQDGNNIVVYPVQAPSDNYIEEEGNFVLSTFWIGRALEP